MVQNKTAKCGRPKTGQDKFAKSISLSKRQIEWLDQYPGDSSKLIRQLLDDYIDVSANAQPEAVKLILRIRILQEQQKKTEKELDYKVASSPCRIMDFAKRDYEKWLNKETSEAQQADPAAYQRELERLKQLLDVAKASYQAFEDNHDALEKQIKEIENQLLNLKT